MQSLKLHLKFKKFIYKYWAVLWIVVVWFIFANPYFLKGLVPFPARYLVDFFPPWNNYNGMPVKNNAMPDIITQIYPWKKITIDALKEGQIPFWNPYQFSGNAHIANYQSAAFTPFNLLFFVFSFIDAWSILILLQPLLAGLFIYLYMREIKTGKAGALFSGIAFMFSGFLTVWMGYGTLAYAILYLPLLLYGVERYYNKQDKISAAIIILSIPLSFFSGHFQTSLYFLLTGILYIAFKGITARKIRLLVTCYMLLVTGLLFSLPQLIPSIQLYQQSVRSSLFKTGEIIPWSYLITAIAPDFFGSPVTRNDWFGHYAEWASFSGTITVILAFAVFLMQKKDKKVYFFAFLGLFSLLLAFNTPLVDLMVKLKIPVLSTSAASRIIVLFSFSIAVLSGIFLENFSIPARLIAQAFDGCLNFPKDQFSDVRNRVIIYLSLWIVLVVSVWVLLFRGNLLFVENISFDKLYIAKRNFILPTLMIITGVSLFILNFIDVEKLQKKLKLPVKISKRNYCQLIVTGYLLLVSFDMLRFSTKWMPFEERKFVYPKIQVLDYLKQHTGNYRVFGNIGNEALAPFKLQGIEGYDPLYPKRYGEFIRSAYDGNIRPAERSVVKLDKNGEFTKLVLDFLGVKYIIHSKGDGRNLWAFPFWQYPDSFGAAVWSDEKYEIYENTQVFPRAYLVYNYKIAKSDKEIIDKMFKEEIDLRKTAILEQKPNINNLLTEQLSNRAIKNDTHIIAYTPNEVVIEVETAQPALLFLSDNYYPGWNAYVNGVKTKIYRANYSFRAVEVPSGKSTVKFKYENWYF